MKFISFSGPEGTTITIDLESIESVEENFGGSEMTVTMKSGKEHVVTDDEALEKIRAFIEENSYEPEEGEEKKEKEKGKKIKHDMEQTMKM